jgi:hypothetical protein
MPALKILAKQKITAEETYRDDAALLPVEWHPFIFPTSLSWLFPDPARGWVHRHKRQPITNTKNQTGRDWLPDFWFNKVSA